MSKPVVCRARLITVGVALAGASTSLLACCRRVRSPRCSSTGRSSTPTKASESRARMRYRTSSCGSHRRSPQPAVLPMRTVVSGCWPPISSRATARRPSLMVRRRCKCRSTSALRRRRRQFRRRRLHRRRRRCRPRQRPQLQRRHRQRRRHLRRRQQQRHRRQQRPRRRPRRRPPRHRRRRRWGRSPISATSCRTVATSRRPAPWSPTRW